MTHEVTYDIDDNLIKSSQSKRLQAVEGFASALGLEDLTIENTVHKAHGESIKRPHWNPIIWELEKEFNNLWNAEKIVNKVIKEIGIYWTGFGMRKAKSTALYRPGGQPLTDAEMERLKKIIMDALGVDEEKVNEILLKAALTSKITSVELMGQEVKVDIASLPATLRTAIKELGLNPLEVNAIKFAFQYAAMNITNVSVKAQTAIQTMIVDAMQTRMGTKQLASKMFNELALNDSSVLNRDWERIAVTEVNRAASDAFIASRPNGSYVIGHSFPDACQYCLRMINLKIYKVTDDPPEDYSSLKPGSKKYKELAKRWETEIWVGKDNVDRGLPANKRVNDKLVPREHYELGMPTIPVHPSCRCRWTVWVPELYYIKEGQVEFAVDEGTKKEQQEWLKQNPHIKIGK